MRNWIIKHDESIQRLLEILPGFVSWNIILFPYWGILVIPNVVAYFILSYNIYWFYQSAQIAISATISHFKIQASMAYDWLADLKVFPDWKKVHQVIIIPTYKEPLHTLERTLESIANQTMPKDQMTIALAMEAKEPEEDRLIKVKALESKYGNMFGNFLICVHTLLPGEAAGKASNERFAALEVKEKLIKKGKFPLEYTIVTSCDADHIYHKNHFSYLAYLFLDDPHRYERFWQPAVLFYNNIWKIPAITRITNTIGSIIHIALLGRKDRLINMSNYSLSFKLLDDVGYWDADKIPEDWGIFFKSYYKTQGKVEVEPLYLPIYADAAQGESLIKTLRNEYEQKRRWAWGASDDPWIIKNYFLTPGVPFWDKTLRVLYALQSHFLWPVHFFIITIGLQLPILLNPRFAKTALGYTVPKLSSFVLSVALVFLLIMLLLDRIYKPKRPKEFPLWRAILSPLEYFLMPVAGFFFSALPGLDAHTRLMLGKYIEYKVTEKV
ncbi:hypothetical protein COX03_00070 [Candidatus Woesebacteria bacterium CG22_combo_CG10-13_8_21_14_all_39_10]|uniref:Glycosyltransferase 2-like domain-containing protein n=2 Tax=Candidatus Woeseibacteriota TaxID=1752722 RepID=A0A2H0BLX8_9BACT|nr:MAG: hypothetical protein COX03_00070 [Candidatus Woesebacteria bacterium CG22_combo_CG10-13_8_21_14_all_39_10]PIZ49567.1 MAG: hypothetical protein COY29_01560 [Candidatus Woesebacteria bacterium CG_4_10_14_0_2_um_filter_39_14]